MSEAQEIQALNSATENLANTLGYTPEAQLAKRQRADMVQQSEEWRDQTDIRQQAADAKRDELIAWSAAGPTRKDVATHNEYLARNQVKADKLNDLTADYLSENPPDATDPNSHAKNFQGFTDYVREKNPNLYNQNLMRSSYLGKTAEHLNLREADLKEGQVYAEQLAKTFSGAIKNTNTVFMNETDPAKHALAAENLSVSVQDAVHKFDPDINFNLTVSKNKAANGEALVDVEFTDFEAALASGADVKDKSKLPVVNKKNMTMKEFQDFSGSLLARTGKMLPNAYEGAQLGRKQKNIQASKEPKHYYSLSTGRNLVGYMKQNKDWSSSFHLGAGGAMGQVKEYGTFADAEQEAGLHELNDTETLYVQNRLAAWNDDPTKFGAKPGDKYSAKFLKETADHVRGMATVQAALEAQKKSGAGAGSDKFSIEAQKVIKNTLPTDGDPRVQEVLQGVAGIYGPAYASAGRSPDQLASTILSANSAYQKLSINEREKTDYEKFIAQRLADGISGGGSETTSTFDASGREDEKKKFVEKNTPKEKPVRNRRTLGGGAMYHVDNIAEGISNAVDDYGEKLSATKNKGRSLGFTR
jgi:hypothetical protein